MKKLIRNIYFEGKTQDILIDNGVFAEIADVINDNNAEVINANNKAILPAFYNTHNHASMMFLRGIGEDKELFPWLSEDIWPREANITPDDMYDLTRFANLEMIKTGTVFFSDMYFFGLRSIPAVQDMGLRAAISIVAMDLLNPDNLEAEKTKLNNFFADKFSDDKVFKAVSCHAIYTCSAELYKFAKDLANKQGAYLHTHVSETQKEVDDCLSEHNQTPVEYLDSLGVLDSKTIIAHAVHLTDNDLKIIKQKGVVIAHCPTSNLKLNSGQMNLDKYLSQGINVTLGTDGVASNNSLSMLSEMKIAALSAKSIANSSCAAKVDDVFDVATINGAKAFGINAGKIAVGYEADFILVDLDNHYLVPNHNLKSNMIYSADSSCITDVYCAGNALMNDGYVDHQEDILAKFRQVCIKLNS